MIYVKLKEDGKKILTAKKNVLLPGKTYIRVNEVIETESGIRTVDSFRNDGRRDTKNAMSYERGMRESNREDDSIMKRRKREIIEFVKYRIVSHYAI